MFKNLLELIKSMPDEKTCAKYLAANRWENGIAVCPYCGHGKCYVIEGGKRYKCASNKCYKRFHVTVGTIFEASNVPLTKWFTGLYLATAHKKGISSYQLGKDIGVTQKTAWFMLHRIREAMKPIENIMLDNVVEVDSTFTAGRIKNKHVDERKYAHISSAPHTDYSTEVLGYLERGGDLKLKPVDKTKTFKQNVIDNVKPEAIVVTDNFPGFVRLNEAFAAHLTINHKKDEYVRGFVYTNSVEGAFSHFKRMVFGTYHQITVKHLSAYCNEFAYKFNSRDIKDVDRFTLSLKKVNTRLTYKSLVEKK